MQEEMKYSGGSDQTVLSGLLDPKNDLVFKAVFAYPADPGSEERLKRLINLPIIMRNFSRRRWKAVRTMIKLKKR